MNLSMKKNLQGLMNRDAPKIYELLRGTTYTKLAVGHYQGRGL